MEVKEQLKDIDIEQVVSRLGGLGLKQKGHNLQGECPTGHGSQGGRCFSINARGNYYHCFHCGIGGDCISLVELVQGTDFVTAMKWLAEQFRPDLLKELENGGQSPDPERQRSYSRAKLMEGVYQWGREILLNGLEAEKIRTYLQDKRGLSPEELKQVEWFYLPPQDQVREHLKEKYLPDQVEDLVKAIYSGHTKDRLRLAMPYRDRRGAITGLIKRGVESKEYDTPALKQDMKQDLCGLHKVQRGTKRVLIVEGYPDTLSLPVKGIKDVVAFGQGGIGKKQIEGLKLKGIEQVVLCYDNDSPTIDTKTGEEKRLNLSRLSSGLDLLQKEGLSVFVIDPDSLGEHKDPDEFVQAKGAKAFQELIDRSEQGAKWKARNMLRDRDLSQDLELDQTVREIIEYEEQLSPLESKLFMGAFKSHADLDPAELDLRLEHIRKQLQEEKFKKSVLQALKEAQNAFERQDGSKTLEKVYKASEKLSQGPGGVVLPTPYTFDELMEDLSQYKGGYETGYQSIDQKTHIPEGAITLIAGRPGHGKTTFMLNLFHSLSEIYSGQKHYFFSYEEAKSRILLKLLMLRANKDLGKKNFTSYFKYMTQDRLMGKEGQDIEVEKALSWYEARVKDQRLTVQDCSLSAEDFISMLRNLCQEHQKRGESIGSVFLDYIQLLSLKNPQGVSSRQIELQKISGQLRDLVKEFGFPLIMGAQLNREGLKIKGKSMGRPRLEHLREAGDLEQDCNLCFGILNQESLQVETREEGIKEETEVGLDLYCLKNRDGQGNWKQSFTFRKPTLRISEKKKPGEF